MRLLALALSVWAAHEGPAPKLGPSTEALSRQNLLAEMWQRRVLTTDVSEYKPEDVELLERIRRAEKGGAIGWLRRRADLKGLAVEARSAGGEPILRLTREGHYKYVFLKTQEAIRYFETRDVPAKSVFLLTDTDGRPAFADGLLTEWGEALYDRAASGKPAFWRTPEGEVKGNRRRPPAK